MSDEKERYDRAHSSEHESMKGTDDPIGTQFGRGLASLPSRAFRDLTEGEIEEKARRDARDSRYDPPESSSGCFITTACVAHFGLKDDCEELTTLRWFRDNYIKEIKNGPKFIQYYYVSSPIILEKINSLQNKELVFHNIYLDIKTAVGFIKIGEMEEAFNIYFLRLMYLQWYLNRDMLRFTSIFKQFHRIL